MTVSARTGTAALLAGAATLGLLGCGASTSPTTATGSRASALDSSASPGTTEAVQLTDGWAKAGSELTSAFGTLRNPSGADIRLQRATSDVAARTELHTMARQSDGTIKMVEKEGGFLVPAGGSVTLAPGGDHIMLIDLTKALENGDQVTVTLTSDTGGSYTWTVPVRTFAGAQETYAPEPTTSGATR